MAIFVYGILSKWYLLISVASIVVVFWVFKGLSDAGVLKKAETTVFDALNETKSVARYCVPKIMNFSSFWDCLQNPPRYPDDDGMGVEQLQKQSPTIDPDIYSSRNPYDYDNENSRR